MSNSSTSSRSVNQSQSTSGSFIPDYEPQLSFLGQFGRDAQGLMDTQFNWAQGQFANNTDLTNHNINSYLSGAALENNQAGQDLGQYNSYLPGNLAQLDETARSYSSPARVQSEMGRAEADTAQNFQSQRDNITKQLESYGVDPSAGRFAGQLETLGAQQGAAEAAAGTQARLATEATGRALTQQEFQDLGVLPGQAATETNVGYQGTTGAQNAALANTSLGALTLGTTPQYLTAGVNDIKFQPLGTNAQSTSSGSSASDSRSVGAGSGGSSSSKCDPNGGGFGCSPGEQKDPEQQQGGEGSGGGGSGGGGSGSGGGSGGGGSGGGGDGSGGGGSGGGDSGGGATNQGISSPFNPPDPCAGMTGLEKIKCAAEQDKKELDARNAALEAAARENSNGPGQTGIGAGSNQPPPSGGGGGSAPAMAEGGDVPGAIPESMSPSGGQQVDDVPAHINGGGPANLNVGEFVIPRDVTEWMGQKFFQDMIMKSRKAMGSPSHAPAHPTYQNGKQHAATGGALDPTGTVGPLPGPNGIIGAGVSSPQTSGATGFGNGPEVGARGGDWTTGGSGVTNSFDKESGALPDPSSPIRYMTESTPRSTLSLSNPLNNSMNTSTRAPGVQTVGFTQDAQRNAQAHMPPSPMQQMGILPPGPNPASNLTRSWGQPYTPPASYRAAPQAQQNSQQQQFNWSGVPAFMAWARQQPWFAQAQRAGAFGSQTTGTGSGTGSTPHTGSTGGTGSSPPTNSFSWYRPGMTGRDVMNDTSLTPAQRNARFQLVNGWNARGLDPTTFPPGSDIFGNPPKPAAGMQSNTPAPAASTGNASSVPTSSGAVTGPSTGGTMPSPGITQPGLPSSNNRIFAL